VIFIGVIVLLIGIGALILWIILEFFERLRLRTRYRQSTWFQVILISSNWDSGYI